LPGRYICRKGKKTSIGKANKICLIRRCPELMVNRKVGNKYQQIPVILESMVGVGSC